MGLHVRPVTSPHRRNLVIGPVSRSVRQAGKWSVACPQVEEKQVACNEPLAPSAPVRVKENPCLVLHSVPTA